MKERAGNWSVKRQSSWLLSTLPFDWQWETHPRHLVLRSQSLNLSCHHVVGGQLITKSLSLGAWYMFFQLSAKCIIGSVSNIECLSGGKWLLYTTAHWPSPSRSDIFHFKQVGTIVILTSLEKLYLNDNDLREVPSEVFRINALTHLYLKGKPHSYLPPASEG